MSITEKEVRGAITEENLKIINSCLSEFNYKKHEYKQVSIYCDTDNIPTIGSVTQGKGRLIIDIRDNKVKFKIKVGNALEFSRKEYVINCNMDSLESLAILLKLFGVTYGFVRTFDRTDYVIDDEIQFTVKLNCLMGDHFELERNSDDERIKNKFENIINKFKLNIWSKEELAKAIEADHNKVKSQNILQVVKGMI